MFISIAVKNAVRIFIVVLNVRKSNIYIDFRNIHQLLTLKNQTHKN